MEKVVQGVSSQCSGSTILTHEQVQQIESGLPEVYQCYDWQRVYSLTEDGADVVTMVSKAKKYSKTLLVVKDAEGVVFGALIGEQLKMGEREAYYGGGNCGVWSLKQDFQYFSSSGRNMFFLLTSHESIALGGGGNFALYLDSELNKGASGECATYASPCLAAREDFSCVDCEMFVLNSILGV
ncbi:TLD-domain-containing protein [Ochromonadaceae sp. CCMP2298]|nr:TLD-domain-containing protein [Ochromonadaceae sp. CCMP2298]|mmetsp:Transcript_33013/g.72699  ORF Transcript_33013/g.72699 Transcript_33013/m.72699 type:complete len:183 (-) Transcript_33013:36-584(-)|eukprot:CAMPEP_0173290024 /NCGR_PEP_ID=MMETSP1143-20121109/11335_1 /TAXON_ID=483371 /ORGANISM="non described non described, Strain CCMP2298" /LENGTH=182 /DNA_ID=CAMNT_0014229039 /DNA_START=232 /DNA_END=780 /DNA_ORIENTATION=-